MSTSGCITLYRGSKSILEKHNHIYKHYQVIVEIPDELHDKSREELLGVLCKYKMGDGIHHYNDLPYLGEIPASFKQYVTSPPYVVEGEDNG